MKDLINALKEVDRLRKEYKFGNIMYNEQYIELMIADELGHIWNDGQGPDAFGLDGEKYEYKTINSVDGKGSFQFHWITTDNVHKYEEFDKVYFVWRDGMIIKEIVEVEMSDIFPMLESKAKSGGKKGHWSVSLKKIKEYSSL